MNIALNRFNKETEYNFILFKDTIIVLDTVLIPKKSKFFQYPSKA